MNDYSINALKEALRSLAGNAFIPHAVKYLSEHADAINTECIAKREIGSNDSYGSSGGRPYFESGGVHPV